MKDHEKHGAAIRDAVARGDLEEATREATILASLPVGGPIDENWRVKLDAMTAAASKLSNAPTIKEAAAGLGPLAKTCGDCHTMLGRSGPTVASPGGQASGVRPTMLRHQWAVSQMWDGLVIPSEDAWRAGALGLSEEPMTPEALTPGRTPVPRVGALQDAVHDLGRRAVSSSNVEARMKVYGEAMATCAQCHRWLGGGPAGDE
jgi:cytochrome c553